MIVTAAWQNIVPKKQNIQRQHYVSSLTHFKLEELRMHEISRITTLIAGTSLSVGKSRGTDDADNREMIDHLTDLHKGLGRITGITTLLEVTVINV